MHYKKYFIGIILSLFWISISFAQNRTQVCVDFEVGKTTVDPEFSNNAAHLSDIISLLHTTFADSSLTVSSVEFSGMASPEGEMELNYTISRQRMEALEQYIRSCVDIPDNLIAHNDRNVSWNLLDSLVLSSDMPYLNEVSNIIRNTPILIYKQSKIVDGRTKQLMDLNYGHTWREMNRRFFHAMRNACAVVVSYEKVTPKPIEEKEKPVTIIEEPATIVEETQELETIFVETAPELKEWTRHLHLKTNTVGLAMLVANAAIEIDLSPHWSFNLPIYYSAWNYTTHTIKFRTFTVQPEIRYWFTDNDGWFIGAHGGIAYYNLAWDNDYRIQDHNRDTPALGAGLGVGYRMPISKRWKMEFALGGGVYDLHYDKFHNKHNGLLVKSVKKTYVGIDQVAISFSYMFDLKKKRK